MSLLENADLLTKPQVQIYTGIHPFPHLKDIEIVHHVVTKRRRPEIPSNAVTPLKDLRPLLEGCWHNKPRKRPNAIEISYFLEKAVAESKARGAKAISARGAKAISARGAKAISDAIDRQIMEDSKLYKKECKILLLGSGDSGKSTIVNQMKIIHHGGFDKRERTEYRTTIYKNVLDSAGTLARVVRRVGLGAFDEGIEREYAMAVLTAFPPVPGAPGDDSSVDGSDEGDIEVGVDPIPFTRVEEHAYAASAGLGTAEVPTPVVDVFAQTHAVLTPALADAIWHVASAPAVERFVEENSADSYLMDSAA
jgi:hypothetical protein